MKTFLIQIVEQTAPNNSHPGEVIEHYRRRVEIDDIGPIVQRLDQALNVPVRKRRRDSGQPRSTAEA